MLGIIVVICMAYVLWGILALLVFNYVFTRTLFPEMNVINSSMIIFAASLIVFWPLVTPAHSFFGDMPMPWYVSLMATPPSPELRVLPVFVLVLSSGSSLAFFQWWVRRPR